MAQTSRSADLTSGPMLQKIILFSIPLAASSILQLLFNAADVVVVGRFAGSTALAAVGSNGSLINLLVNLFVGLSLGANVVAARCFGAKDERGVQNTVQTSVTLGLVSGVLLAVVGFFAARGLLERARILTSEAEIVKAAQQRAAEITTAAQNEVRTLRQTVTDYCDNMLRNTEETMVENAAQVKNVRANLRQNAKKNG